MSKTRKTRPLMVRALDGRDQTVQLEEVHDHRNGECDLPTKGYAQPMNGHRATRCYYDYVHDGVGVCGCPMCTAHFERREERRRDRHDAKRDLHGLAEFE